MNVCIIYSDSSLERTYDVQTTSAMKCAIKFGRCEGNETVIVRRKNGKELSRVIYCWDGKYYRCTI